MKNRTFVLITALFFAMTPMIAGAQTQAYPDASAKVNATCGVTVDEIVEYMACNGIRVATVAPMNNGTCNAYVTAHDGKHYVVYISAGIITGYEDQY
jgi:hypothetical protein